MRFKLKGICPVLFLFVVSVFVVPSHALGQSVDNRYCPNPSTDFFKGSIYYQNGKPWIETIVDPEFEQKVLRGERKINGDIPLTPVYNLVVRIKPEFNYYCIPGWAGKAFPVTADKLPASIPVVASIVVGSKYEEVVTPGVLLRTNKKDEQDRFIYEMKFRGWPNGITDSEGMEKLLSAIAKGDSVYVSLQIGKTDETIETIRTAISFSSCVPMWGSGKHRITQMRGKDMPALALTNMSESFLGLFMSTSPLRQYKDHFSHRIDLTEHDDSNWKTEVLDEDGNKRFVKSVAFHKVIEATSCGGNLGDTHIFWSSKINRAYALPSVGVAFLGPEEDALTALHEFGHAFGRLMDEYLYNKEYPILKAPSLFLKFQSLVMHKNCSTVPANDFKFDGWFYGSTQTPGCGFLAVGLGVNKKVIYKPSTNSVMNTQWESANFNTVSCGYLISEIIGGKGKEYFSECAKMDGIVKEGVTEGTSAQGVFSPALAWLNDLISSSASLTAQVVGEGATTPSTTSEPEFLIIESFDRANPKGEIVEVVPDAPPTNSIAPGLAIVDPRDEIFADFKPASFPIFDPEFFDELAQEIAASGESEPTLWQKFLNLFSSDDATTPLSGDETYPPVPLVSAPSIRDAHDTIVMSGGNVESGEMTLIGIISVPKNEWFSEVKNTFQYASGQGAFVDWVSFTFPEGLKPGDTATDTYTWQAGEGDWRFRLCMDSKERGQTCGEETSVTIVGSVSQKPTTTPSCAGPSKLVPTTPILSGTSAGAAGKLRSGMMKVSTNITNKTGTASDATEGSFEYSQNGVNFTPWVNFSVPALSPCAKSSTSYSWEGGEGTWFMRACIKGECSESAEMEVVP